VKTKAHRWWLVAVVAILACVVAAAVVQCIFFKASLRQRTESSKPDSLPQLLDLPKSGLTNLDIASINLLCADELPGAGNVALSGQLQTLDDWAKRVASETTRHWYRYQQNPKEFNHSEAFFRMLMLTVVLAEDFHIKYDPQLRMPTDRVTPQDGFFARSDSVFLSGLLGPERNGTCSSLPVLYVAIGRRLGYPVHLVTTKGHLFVRWDGRGERFNIEAAGEGLNTFDDDYYRKWPFPFTAGEESAEAYLENLDAPGELAVFLSIRGMSLRDNGRMSEAAQAFANAAELAPQCHSYRAMHEQLAQEVQTQRSFGLTINKRTSP